MQNQTLIQYFHWYYNEEQTLWVKVKNEAENLGQLGFTKVWLPPAYKASGGGYSVGYDAYDLFDLGEFDQKGSVPTKYGSKAEFLEAVNALRDNGVGTLADVVFNHKAGADELEQVKVRKVDPENRNEFISDEFEIQAWTKFTFPGRGDTYSSFIWDHQCFSGVDWAEDTQEDAIFSIQNQYGDKWEEVVSEEHGNYDYLMYADIDFRNPAVREELKYWGKWMHETCGLVGFRLDAVKHISHHFFNEWIDFMQSNAGDELFIVGENWEINSAEELQSYIDRTEGRMQLFDSLLHLNFYEAAKQGNQFDLQTIFDNTLVQLSPNLAVTLVDNHDTQPLQALESYVDYWFRPIAYSIILLREQGIPCVFYPDVYGAKYEENGQPIELNHVEELPELLRLRKEKAYGLQRDYFDHPNCVGFTREGDTEHDNSGLAVVISNGDEGIKRMEMGEYLAGQIFIDALQKRTEEVEIGADGFADFYCAAGSVSVWVLK